MGGNGYNVNTSATSGTVSLYWTDGFANYGEDGLFATILFEVSSKATVSSSATLSLSYEQGGIYDVNENAVEFFCINSDVEFIKHLPGDINGDGSVNSMDTTRLMRYLAGWDVEVNESALDVNGDGEINTKDVTRLMRYLADWNVPMN